MLHNAYGWIPEKQHKNQLKVFASESVSRFPWDDTDKPPIIAWENFKQHVTDYAVSRDDDRRQGFCNWPWVIAEYFHIPWFDPDQGQLGTCAGFAADTASWCMMLQHLADGVELEFIKTNPYPAWVLGREDANYRGGGATMSMVLNGINKYGRFPESIAGTYEESIRSQRNWRSLASPASEHQVGCCFLGDLSRNEMADAIIMCVRAGHPVAFGGSTAIANTPTYQNGIKQGVIRGTWAHATAFVAYREHKDVVYLAHMNSWGKVYGNDKYEDAPASVVWLSEADVRRMCSGNYADAFVITYAESTQGKPNWSHKPYRITR